MLQSANNQQQERDMSLRTVLENVANYFAEIHGTNYDGAIVIPFQGGRCLDVRLKMQKSARNKHE